MKAMRIKIDLDNVITTPVDDGESAFHDSLHLVLRRIAPLTARIAGLAPEDQMHRLAEAINIVLSSLEELTGIVDSQLLVTTIDRVTELAITGGGIEIQMGVAGDLRVDRRHRLTIDEVVAALTRLPSALQPAATRDGVVTLRRLLALLLLHGWTDDIGDDTGTRLAARRAIVDTIQGQAYAEPAGSAQDQLAAGVAG